MIDNLALVYVPAANRDLHNAQLNHSLKHPRYPENRFFLLVKDNYWMGDKWILY